MCRAYHSGVSEGTHTCGEVGSEGRIGWVLTHCRGDVAQGREHRAGITSRHDGLGFIGQSESVRQFAVENVEILLRYGRHAAENPSVGLPHEVQPRLMVSSNPASRAGITHRPRRHAVSASMNVPYKNTWTGVAAVIGKRAYGGHRRPREAVEE